MKTEMVDINKINPASYNPREITPHAFTALCESIKKFGLQQPLIVNKKTDILISGHQRLKALQALEIKKAPVVYVDLSVAEEKAFNITMNNKAIGGDFTETVKELLAEIKTELGDDYIFDLNLDDVLKDIPDFSDDDSSEDEPDDEEDTCTHIEENVLKEKLDEATLKYLKDLQLYLEQFKQKKLDNLHIELTKNKALINFLQSKYMGKPYRRMNSLAYCPEQFFTKGDNFSLPELIDNVLSKKTNLDRLLFFFNNDYQKIGLMSFFSSTLPVSGARMPADFPAALSKKLISEYCPKENAKIIDPCHGWGGRLIGFLLSSLSQSSYTGVDPSPDANRALEEIKKTITPYITEEKKTIILINKPFEDVTLEDDFYDFSLTSPPYFDTESYAGEESSRLRYDDYARWVESFYKPLINNIYKSLKNNAYFILQVGSQRYPLCKDGIKIAQSIGFKHIDTIDADINRKGEKATDAERKEVCIILKKI